MGRSAGAQHFPDLALSDILHFLSCCLGHYRINAIAYCYGKFNSPGRATAASRSTITNTKPQGNGSDGAGTSVDGDVAVSASDAVIN